MKRNERSSRRFTRLRRTASAGMSVLAAGALLAMATTSASAETVPTHEQLLSQCKKADVCKFTPTQLSTGMIGPEHQVGNTIINCGGTVDRTWSWSETTAEQEQVGLSLSTTAQLLDILNGAASINFSRNFDKSHTTSESITQHMTPFTMAWTTRATGEQVITGDWELHFPSRFYGHYIWYDKDFQVKLEDPSAGYVLLHYRNLTADEAQKDCPGEQSAELGNINQTRTLRGVTGGWKPFAWPAPLASHGVSSG
ncbi:hypothetical protein ABZX85_46935 [Streptomyces sp. NPDC004539]|uniref:hypothetical protein n=1 Tax=Streptomyces sp. NPDC004539 TaxID=3154280 RepID=UPI0033B84668